MVAIILLFIIIIRGFLFLFFPFVSEEISGDGELPKMPPAVGASLCMSNRSTYYLKIFKKIKYETINQQDKNKILFLFTRRGTAPALRVSMRER